MVQPLQDYTVTVRGKKVRKQLPAEYNDAQIRAAFRDVMKGYGIDSSEQAVINQPGAPQSPPPPQPQAPEDFWRTKLGDQGAITATPKTLGGVLQNAVTGGLGMAGLDDRQSQHYGERVFGALNDFTPVGNFTGAEQGARDVYHGLTRGDLAQAGLGAGIFALSALPFGAGAKRAGGKVLQNLLADEAGTFAGRNAKTANLDALRKAEEMHAGGVGRDEIRHDTGWHMGPDGQWRFEIPDNDLRVNHDQFPSDHNPFPVRAEQALHHPALYEAYPELKSVSVARVRPNENVGGDWQQDIKRLRIKPASDARMRSVAGHELQHAVQDLEGFATGGAPTPGLSMRFSPPEAEALNQQYGDLLEERLNRLDADEADPLIPDVERRIREVEGRLKQIRVPENEAYHRLAGETEARNVQTRLDMTPGQRKFYAPWQTQDVDTADQFLLYGSKQANAPASRGQVLVDLAGGGKAPAVIGSDPAQDILAAAREGGQSFANWRAANEAKIGTMFDYSRLNEVPDVPQVPMERYQPPRGPSGRIIEALANPEVVEGINSVVQRGVDSGAGLPWYNTEPLRHAAEGAGVGPEGYGRLMDVVAATSPRSKVTDNLRTASYYNYLRENGIPIPDKPAPGYGSVAQGLHTSNVRGLDANGGWSILQNPKPASFSSNLQGNQFNATIDTHNFRLPGILSQDPRFLETSIQELVKGDRQAGIDLLKRQYPGLPDEVVEAAVKDKGGKTAVVYRPQEWVNKGYIPMETATKDPALWTTKPKDNEYGFYEDFQRREADKMGISPAQYQASMWVGGADETGLGSLPEPFLKTVEARIRYTADRMGLDPAVVRDRFLKGSAPLLGIGGTVLILQDGQIVEQPANGQGQQAA